MSGCSIWPRAAAALFFLLAALLLVNQCPAWATQYFVDGRNGSDARSGHSRAKAWRTLPGSEGEAGRGWVQLQPGDTVFIRSGSTFNQRLLINSAWYSTQASADEPLTIKVDKNWGSGRPVVWDGTGTGGSLIEISAVNGLRLDGGVRNGIRVVNSAFHGIEATGWSPEEKMQGLVLRNLLVSTPAARGIQLWRQSGFHLSWVRCDGGWQGNEASGICIGESGENGCEGGVLKRCTSYHWGPRGMFRGSGTDAYQGFWIVNNNDVTLDYCSAYENAGRGFDIGGVEGGTAVPLSDGITLSYCRSHDNGNDGFGSSAEDMPEDYPSRHLFQYCLAYGNGGAGWQIYEGPTTALYNCVSDQNSTAVRLWGVNPGMEWRNGRQAHIDIYNCVLSRPQAREGQDAAGTLWVGYVNQLDLHMDYNFYVQGESDRAAVWGCFAPGPDIGYGYNDAEAPGGQRKWFQDHGLDEHSLCSIDGHEVGFVDPDARDYHLRPDSDAIDAGCDLGPALDFDVTPVPRRGARDIGAFELP
ncbi:MAG: right-handed parallel beta-helix repeat-containing protein [Pseudomonadota bacterium]